VIAGGRILLIDDDRDFAEATRAVLESVPYEVIVAFDGDEGLAKVQEEQPDLVLLDIIMPTRDGFQVYEKLKSDPELWNIPIIILTGLSSSVSNITYSAHGGEVLEADDFIDKPVRPRELLARIARLLQRDSRSETMDC
jgi:DNA-binding response OmpR family regulator